MTITTRRLTIKSNDNKENYEEYDSQEILRQIKEEAFESVPIIMRTYQENQDLKNTIEIQQRNDPNEIKTRQSYLEVLNQLLEKLDSSVLSRQLMNEKFERLCLWKGQNSDDIKKVEEEVNDFRMLNEKKLENLHPGLRFFFDL